MLPKTQKYIGEYMELTGKGEKLGDHISDKPYPGKEKVLNFLRSGYAFVASPGWDVDCFTGKRIPGEKLGLMSDDYFWGSRLIYYIEKYNLRLPPDIESNILKKAA